MSNSSSNPVAIITGGSDGLGRATALRLASEGCHVVICARRKDHLQSVADEIINETGARVVPIQADVSKAPDIEKLVSETRKIFGGIDIGGTSVKVGFVDNDGTILCRDLFLVERIKNYKNFLKTLHNSIISLMKHLDNNKIIQGYGVGCPGRVNVQEGKVIWCKGKLEYIENQTLGPDLRALLDKPVVCDNDVNSIVLGEALFGKGKDCSIQWKLFSAFTPAIGKESWEK